MIEICSNLYVGNKDDFEGNVRFRQGWAVVHACKEPYHREALGYGTRAAPKDDPEYLIAERDNRLIMNMIDARDPRYIPGEIVDRAILFVSEHLGPGRKVLVHCDQGMSRSPGIGLLYLVSHTDSLPKISLEAAECEFRKIYSPYNPAQGMREFMRINWSKYAGAVNGSME